MTQLAEKPAPLSGFERSLPVGDREHLALAIAAPAAPAPGPTEALRLRLKNIIWTAKAPPSPGHFRQADICRAAEIPAAYLSTWLNWVPGEKYGNHFIEMERALELWLSALDEASAGARSDGWHLVTTRVSEAVSSFIATVRKENGAGVLYGDAGLGKSCALRLFRIARPNAVVVKVNSLNRSKAGMVEAIYKAMGLRKTKEKSSKLERVFSELRKSPRTLVVDDAHKLSHGARGLLFELHDGDDVTDSTRSPLVLVGNPEIMDQIKVSDQHASRCRHQMDLNKAWKIGPNGTLSAEGRAQIAQECREFIRMELPDLPDTEAAALAKDCAAIAAQEESGRYRFITAILRRVAPLYQKAPYNGNVRQCLRDVDSQMVRGGDKLPA